MPDPSLLEVYRREFTPELVPRGPRALQEALDRRGRARPRRPDLDADAGLRLRARPDRPSLGGTRRRARFYTELLTAFPDIRFDLTDIVIGPQGVCEEANVTATQQAPWLGQPPLEGTLEWKVLIWFPWDPEQRLFRGEKVYAFGIDLPVRARAGRASRPARSSPRRGGSAAGAARRPGAGRRRTYAQRSTRACRRGARRTSASAPLRTSRGPRADGERRETEEDEQLAEHLFA